MRILFINDYRKRGGAENYILRLRDVLEERGHKTKLIDTVDTDEDVKFSLNMPGQYIQRYISTKERKLLERIKDYEPDVIHVHNIHNASLPIMRTIRRVDMPAVKTFHDYAFFSPCVTAMHDEEPCSGIPETCLTEGAISPKQYLFRKPVNYLRKKKLPQTFEFALAPSKDLQDISQKWIETKHLPNFVDTEKYYPEGRERSGLLYYGRISEEKGIDLLIKAVSRLETEVDLKIAGGGNTERYENLAEAKDVDAEFLGYLPEDELIEEIQSAKATVLPSKWRESFGLVGIESMACGTPVIGANIGGIPDYITNGENGYLFGYGNVKDLSNKINKIIELEEESYRNMSQEARNESLKLNLENHLDKIISLYQDL